MLDVGTVSGSAATVIGENGNMASGAKETDIASRCLTGPVSTLTREGTLTDEYTQDNAD